MKFQLTARQVEGIRRRFEATVDLKKEFLSAREYAENDAGERHALRLVRSRRDC